MTESTARPGPEPGDAGADDSTRDNTVDTTAAATVIDAAVVDAAVDVEAVDAAAAVEAEPASAPSQPSQRPSPRPAPGPQSSSAQSPARSRPSPRPTPTGARAAAPRGGPVTRIEVQPAQVVAAAGSAIVTAARVGRLLSRSGWRLARQLPGARTVEREAQRLQAVAVEEARRLLQFPGAAAPSRGSGVRPASAEEQRAIAYIRNADSGTAPLRSAMSELLERSVEASRTDSNEYLYGTIISQLVPDEARILAALSDGAHFAAVDVVQKLRRGKQRTVLAHASAVGRQAGLVSPDSTPTYLTRLLNFGLIEFGPEEDGLAVQYDILATDSTVQDARRSARGSVKLERKALQMSAFGTQFWRAADPTRPALPPS